MQCPLTGIAGCFLTPKVLFLAIAALSFLLGIFSTIWPGRSIGFYQWIMARFNWKVEPLDTAKELRNTRSLGIGLIVLAVMLVVVVHFKFCS